MFRVLHVGKFYPPDNGGIESVTASLAKGAAKAGHSVSIHCFEDHGKGDAMDGSVQVYRVPQALKLASQPLSLKYIWRGWRLARKVDLIHVHVPNMLGALLTLFVPKSVKVVIHWHSDVVGKGLLGRILAPLEAAMLRRADRILCTSKPYADASLTVRPFGEKISVVPLGVPDQSDSLVDSQGGLGNVQLPTVLESHIQGRPLVLSVGRLVPYKGYVDLIDAAKLMHKDAAIVIVGGGPLVKHLQDRIDQLCVQDRVILAGRVADQTLSTLLSMATVFCMPSNERSEAFGVAMLEAMMWGLPVVATKIPGSGVPWVNSHGESGINVPPNDPISLATALDDLLSNNDWRDKLAAGARARYEAHFTEQETVSMTLSLYQDVILGKKA
jgi:glycosyltransferase involved in cell wall biosynthesis